MFNIADKRLKAAELFSAKPHNAFGNDTEHMMKELEKCQEFHHLRTICNQKNDPENLRLRKNPPLAETKLFKSSGMIFCRTAL